jgi:hypothetical protein
MGVTVRSIKLEYLAISPMGGAHRAWGTVIPPVERCPALLASVVGILGGVWKVKAPCASSPTGGGTVAFMRSYVYEGG